MEQRVTVIIPTYKPDKKFEKLISGLQKQTLRPKRILVVNTEEELWNQAQFDKTPFVFGNLSGIQIECTHVGVSEFNHGGTRKWAAGQVDTEYFLCMTQDAMPADRFLIEHLVKMMERDPLIGAAYARQLPEKDCDELERMSRSFNYAQESRIKSAKDLEEMGIKTFFCSNVCAIYKKELYDSVGGFPERTIFNEDMICAGHMIQAGLKVAYAADAKVIHSHNYTGLQQFKRNFDLAVSQTDFPEVFESVRSESEGIRLVKNQSRQLLKQGKIHLIPKLIWMSGWKYLGYKCGKSYKKLPHALIMKCTGTKNYWRF